ncbi:L-histidine N(alpha)-methyltransferase [Maribacter sp. 2307ULW6-5]|uniref:L-histidine N(alpha)-methyltransferase n=1 Tax=Maribacter sp. 2307ULW6-5 TaxID=3386275 RepID=UPI0039BD4B77
MQEALKPTLATQFEQDVRSGLTAFPKYLSSKYIYDRTGDRLFQQIMELPEYYLTKTEYQIIERHKTALAHHFSKGTKSFHLLEMGAGDGTKTKILLRHFTAQGLNFSYRPIDISASALRSLQDSLREELPQLKTAPLQGTYFETLSQLNFGPDQRKVILFLGSNIGNLLHDRAIEFLSQIQAYMAQDDLLFIGFDQKKDPQTILDAYNDSSGVTARFNKNLLVRINRELGGNFKVDAFKHWETYDPETGTAKSYLVATQPQDVRLEALDLDIHLNAWESIHTEISQKYDDATVQWLAGQSGLTILEHFGDDRGYYKNYLFTKNL